MLEARTQALDPAGGNARIVLEGARQLARLLADLTIDIGKLGLELLDARMIVQQRRGLFGELRAQRDALLRQAPGQFGIENFGSLDRLAGLQHLADQLCLGFGVRLQRSGIVQLRIEFAHLLVGQCGIVGADEQAGFGAEILHPRFRVGHFPAQTVDLAGQPLPGRPRLLLARVLLQHQIALGNRVGDPRGEIRIARLEFDDDDARLVDRIGRKPVEIGIEHALFRTETERIAADADQRQQRFQRRQPLQHRIELGTFGKPVLPDDLARQIARQ